MIEIALPIAALTLLGAPTNPSPSPPAEGGAAHVAQIAIDADHEFYQLNGADVDQTVAAIEETLTQVGAAFEAGPGVAFDVTAIVVRTSPDDPYTTNDAATLYQQLKNEWLSNQPGVEWDTVQLFTGKNLNGATLALGGQSTLCTDDAMSLIAPAGLGPVDTAHLSAKQLGHVFGATTCQGADCGVMCPLGLGGCGDPLVFGPQAIAEIEAYIDTSGGCLDPAGCAADCDDDGELTVLDFVCFQDLFTSGDDAADCDGSGSLDVLDFLCFQNAFIDGCP